MSAPYTPMDALTILDTYFIENRSRNLDIAAFLDRNYLNPDDETAKADYRYQAFLRIIEILQENRGDRTKAIQIALSDPTTQPLESALGLKAWGAWKGENHAGN